MRRRSQIRISFFLVALVPLSLAGCGGGGGGGGGTPSPVVLSGPYAHVLLFHDSVAGTVHTHTGLLNADAQGTLAIPSLFIVGGGAEFGVLGLPSATYTIGADRTVSITGLGVIPLQGRVSGDGALALVSSRPAADSAMGILMKRDPAPTPAKLAGTWTFMSYGRVIAPGTLESRKGDVTITAAGSYTVNTSTYVYNLDGQINPVPLFGVVEQVGVQPDGWVVNGLDIATSAFRRGALSADGNLILLGGDAGTLNLAGFTLLVRKRSAAAPSDLAGEYHTCAFSTILTNYLNGWGSATFAAGNRLTWSFRANREGAPLDPTSFDLEYGVAPDGTTEFRQSGGGLRWLGAVGPAGGYAILSGGFHDTAPPLLMMCLR